MQIQVMLIIIFQLLVVLVIGYKNKEVIIVRRDTNEKMTVKEKDLVKKVENLLDSMQKDMLNKARKEPTATTPKITKYGIENSKLANHFLKIN